MSPTRPPTLGQIASRGQPAPKEDRGSAAGRGYDRRWRAARANWLAKHPLCAHCRAAGTIRAATVVDHIRPHRGDVALFWARENWQSLCKACHDRKTGQGQ